MEYFPYLLLTEDNTVIGAHMNALEVVSRKLNFTFSLQPYQSYTEMMADLKVQKIDIAIGAIRLTPQRRIDYHMINTDNQYIPLLYFPHQNTFDFLAFLFVAFHTEVWIMVIFTILILTLVLYGIFGKYFQTPHASLEWSLKVSSSNLYYIISLVLTILLRKSQG